VVGNSTIASGALWMTIGCGVGLSLTIIEQVVARIRGPEWVTWLHEDAVDGQFATVKDYLAVAAFWPLFLGMAVFAAFHRQTLFERMARKDPARQDGLRRLGDIAQGRLPYKREWRDIPSEDGQIYLYVAYYRNGEDPIRVTHTITRPPGGMFMCWRYIGSDERSIPLSAVDSLGDAKTACEGDEQWLPLCDPGREGQQDAFFKAQQAKLDEGD